MIPERPEHMGADEIWFGHNCLMLALFEVIKDEKLMDEIQMTQLAFLRTLRDDYFEIKE